MESAMTENFIALGPMWYVAFLLALTVHEAAHALVAKWGGDLTAYEGGQVTLNPAPHIKREPVGTVLVPWLSYILGGWMMGWASAPFDPSWQQRYPHRSAWMALAGPVSNMILVLIAAGGIHLGISMGIFEQPQYIKMSRIVDAASPGLAGGLAVFFSITFSLNLLLAIFNLLPFPPLDGATVIGLFVSEEKALRIYETLHNPQLSLIGIIIAWNVFDKLFDPIFTLSLNLLYPGSNYS